MNGGVLFGFEIGKLSVLILENGYFVWSVEIVILKGVFEFECLVDVDI